MNPFAEMKRESRRLLYNPNRYNVEGGKGTWRVQHIDTGVWFLAEHIGPGELKVLSESGNEYFVNETVCSCPDATNRAMLEERYCKHAAVAMAIAMYQKAKRDREATLDGGEFRKGMK